MGYKELTIDWVLGRVLCLRTSIGPLRWRVLEFYPETGELRCCLDADEQTQTRLVWQTVCHMIELGTIEVE